jgi:hypothetical protein
MPAKVTRNTKPVDGVISIEIAGDTATLEVETGSVLDGLLYYNATRDGRPRLGLTLDGEEKANINTRFIIENLGGSTYKLHAGESIEA